jgi:hypothetical protein
VLRRVFAQPWPRTLVKGVVLVALYALALTVAIVAVAVLTILVTD